jgi:hypothetical protein
MKLIKIAVIVTALAMLLMPAVPGSDVQAGTTWKKFKQTSGGSKTYKPPRQGTGKKKNP